MFPHALLVSVKQKHCSREEDSCGEHSVLQVCRAKAPIKGVVLPRHLYQRRNKINSMIRAPQRCTCHIAHGVLLLIITCQHLQTKGLCLFCFC